jgi:hypothetical protein
MSAIGTLESLVAALGGAVTPLSRWLAPAEVDNFFAQLGLQFSPSVTTASSVAAALQAAVARTNDLSNSVNALESAISSGDAANVLATGATTLKAVAAALQQYDQIGQALASSAGSFPGMAAADIAAFAANLRTRIFDAAVIASLELATGDVVTTLAVLGIIDRRSDPGTPGNASKPAYEAKQLRLDRIGAFLQSPQNYFQTLYGWGSNTFDGGFLFSQLYEMAAYLGLPAVLVPSQGAQPSSIDLFALSLEVDLSAAPPGLKADLLLPLAEGYNYSATLTPTKWTMTASVTGVFPEGIAARLSPPATVTIVLPPGTASGEAQAQFALTAPDANSPIVIVGQTGGSVLQATSVTCGVGVAMTAAALPTADPTFQAAVTGGKLIIDMSDADGFLSSVTSGAPIEASFDIACTWQFESGLHITGGGQLEIDLPLHVDLGPVTFDTVYVIGGISNGDLTLELSAALGVTLGPIQASVDRVGVTGALSFPSSGGNLGPADLTIGFKPPNGLGLEIDAGPASGGGYISFDPAQGQYAGVLQVSILDVVQVEVIGVIDTIMPDGSSGFSFILIITFDLPPIQLGFGFTLNGVGGLGGVNRTINTTALQAGFVAHSLNSILFPPDPVANAPEIISNIRNFFPVAQNSYVFGPMMEVGWGTPTLITLEIGVVLELPNPVVIVLLGLVDVALPDADAPLIQIHIDILGELDFGTKTLELEGDMYDSSVLIYSMAGSLYFSVSWGSDPNFVYSVGGFNPHFNTAGLNIPPMQRCSVSIGVGDNPRISANNYFAVTSNSLQFGANVQAYASAAGFSIQGYLGFDVLIIFSPFSFEFDFTVSFSVSFEGVNLLGLSVSGSFSGPRPWNFNGSASISILFWTVSASVNLTWGDSTPVTIPQKPVLPDLANALQTPGNWSAALPAGMTPAITLTTPTGGSAQILVYPMGTLSVRENVTPLDVPITRYGNATPSDGNEFAISDVQINNQETQRQTLQEYFAPSQFNALSDADKLSAPSFELYDAGVTIGSSAIDTGEDSARTVVYEEFYIDSPMSYSRSTGPYLMDAAISTALGRQGAGFLSPVTHTGMSKYSAGSSLGAIATADAGFVIANTNDLSVRSDLSPAAGVTYFQARAALATHLASTPADSGNLQIMSLYEVAA